MRFSFLAVAAVLGVVAGCKPPPPQTVDVRFRSEIRNYFNTLNQDALARKDALRTEQAMAMRNPAMQAPTGTIYSTFTWDENGFIVENFKCQICGAKLLLPFPSAEYLCRSCGHCPYKTGHPKTNLKKAPCEVCVSRAGLPVEPVEAQKRETFKNFEGCIVKDMYEVTKTDKERGLMRATVRYVRRLWAYDDRGTVAFGEKAMAKAQLENGPYWMPVEYEAGGSRYNKLGYHRSDTMFVGEISFEYHGSELTVLSGPTEQPVRPWTDLLGAKN
jgi:hypothetical protein